MSVGRLQTHTPGTWRFHLSHSALLASGTHSLHLANCSTNDSISDESSDAGDRMTGLHAIVFVNRRFDAFRNSIRRDTGFWWAAVCLRYRCILAAMPVCYRFSLVVSIWCAVLSAGRCQSVSSFCTRAQTARTKLSYLDHVTKLVRQKLDQPEFLRLLLDSPFGDNRWRLQIGQGFLPPVPVVRRLLRSWILPWGRFSNVMSLCCSRRGLNNQAERESHSYRILKGSNWMERSIIRC